ncbi:MAG TPA: tetratricopeptide repeat protein [Steroidobacteraceae bacterium]|jgi:tetratricopeptide (TPR) repeat protein|nr:tetratricopeptide repeat protein [Steroidobacteraceae bacterium]
MRNLPAPQNPSPGEIRQLLTMINGGHYAQSENRARALIERQPNVGVAWKALGVSLLMQGKDALPALRKAAQLLPDDADTHRSFGNALQDQGQFADAAASYRRAVAIMPDFAEAYDDLGTVLRELGLRDEAVASYRRALQINPDCAEAHGNLGNALRELGQLDAAVASYRRALASEPELSEAHNNLGNVLRELGQLDAAVASYCRALQIKPNYAEAHGNLGNVLRELGQFDAAVASYRNALEFSPDSAEVHCNLGNALHELGQLDAAATSYQRALILRPDYAEAYASQGILLRLRGLPDEAEIVCRKALEVAPESAAIHIVLAELHADRGQFARAEELFKRATAIEPNSPDGWAGIGRCHKMRDSEAPWLTTVQGILAQHLRPRQEINLRYALGKYFDDVGDFEQAFGSYQRANELSKRCRSGYDRQRQTRLVDRIICRFDQKWLARARSDANASTRPVLIVGMPRSGTTLVEQILASHPAVFGAGELTFWNAATARYEASLLSGECGASTLRELASDYLQLLERTSTDALRVVDKMPTNFLFLGLIHAALPNARIIHVRRNPIDTCLSVYFQYFATAYPYANDLEDLAHYYTEYLRVMQHWRAILPESAMLDMPYEALIDEQEVWSRKMLEFIGLPWDSRCLDFHRTDRTVVTTSRWQVRQPISKSSRGRWRNYEKFVGPLRSLMELTPRR